MDVRRVWSAVKRRPVWYYGNILAGLVMLFICLQAQSFSVGSLGAQSSPLNLKANDGVLDLSGYDFIEAGPIKLEGMWKFFPSLFLSPDQQLPAAVRSGTIKVPADWSETEIGGEQVSDHGFGTYVLDVLLPEKRPELVAVYIPPSGTSSRIYLNGQLVGQIGEPGETKSLNVPGQRPVIISVNEPENHWRILIHQANFNFAWGGMWDSPQLGSIKDIYSSRENMVHLKFAFVGAFLMMSFFHLTLFLLLREDKLSLTFSVLTCILVIRLFSVEDALILNLFPDISFSVMKKLAFGSFYMTVPICVTFLRQAFPEEIDKDIVNTFLAVGLGCTVLVVVSEPERFSETLTLFQLFSVTAIIYSIQSVVKACQNGREGARALLVGGGVLILFAINDMLYAQRIIWTGYYIEFGVLAFVIAQSFLVNIRFVKAYRLNDHLNRTLEKKVKQRTRDLKKAYEEIKALALTDPLTGVPNRRKITELIAVEQSRMKRNGSTFAVALLDIDNFKAVNDNYGHDMGDEVIREIAKVAISTIREQDKVARWGGEEFLLLFPDSDVAGACRVADRIRERIGFHRVTYNGITLSVTVTIGIACHNSSEQIDDTIKRADEALYRGKSEGKNRVISSDPVSEGLAGTPAGDAELV